MYTLEVVRQRMEYLTNKMETSDAFLIKYMGYSPNVYRFIGCRLYIKKHFEGSYVLVDLSLNDLMSTDYKFISG